MINIKSSTALFIFFALLLAIVVLSAQTHREYAFLAQGYLIATLKILIQRKVDQALNRKNENR